MKPTPTAYIGLRDPKTAKEAHEAGVGAVIDVDMGGGSELEGEPVKAKAHVKAIQAEYPILKRNNQ